MKNIYRDGGKTDTDITSQEILSLLQGMQSAQEKSDAEFDPMKGRTFIPRMSPELKRLLIEGLQRARAKRKERKKAETERKTQTERENEKRRILRQDTVRDRAGLIVSTDKAATPESIPGMGKEVDLKRSPYSQDINFNYGGKILKKYKR